MLDCFEKIDRSEIKCECVTVLLCYGLDLKPRRTDPGRLVWFLNYILCKFFTVYCRGFGVQCSGREGKGTRSYHHADSVGQRCENRYLSPLGEKYLQTVGVDRPTP